MLKTSPVKTAKKSKKGKRNTLVEENEPIELRYEHFPWPHLSMVSTISLVRNMHSYHV